GNRFCVVVENVGSCIEHDAQRFFYSLKIGDQNFDSAIGSDFSHFADGFGKNACAAEVIVIAIHAGDDGVLQLECCHSFGYATRFVQINRLWTSFGHGAKSAAPGTNISEQHEGGGAVVPALADVRALGRLATRM